MRIEQEIQSVIEERAPEFMPFLKFIDSTEYKPVEIKGRKLTFDDKDLTTIIIGVYAYALKGKNVRPE